MKKSDRSNELDAVMRAEYAFYNCYRKDFLKTQREYARKKLDFTANAIFDFKAKCEAELQPDDYPECYDRDNPLRSDQLLQMLQNAQEEPAEPKTDKPIISFDNWSQMSLCDLGYVF